MLINCTCHVRLCVYMAVGTGFIHAFIKLMLLRFLCIVIETLCTGSRRSSRWGLCRRWLHRGLSLWQSPVRPVRHCLLTRTGEHRAPVVVIFKTSYPVSCMYVRDFIVILLNTCYYICIYVSWRFLAKFYDMCTPETLCHCLFYLLFTCTLSEMMNKRCPINHYSPYFILPSGHTA